LYNFLVVNGGAVIELISRERRALADALDGLTAGQWNGATLCEGWTPRHVLAHLTMPFRISGQDFMAGLQQAGGDFTAYSDAIAERDSQLPYADLVAVLRDNADNPWSPPGGGLVGALSHDLIHGLDITWPLSIEYPIPTTALTAVLDMMVSPGTRTVFGVPVEGLWLQATDLDWTSGEGGALLAGRGSDLLLMLAGRRLPLQHFRGDGVPRVSPVSSP
jgi:uncharacterized protein (TIGR03083 family)